VWVGGRGVCRLEEKECVGWRKRSVWVAGRGVCGLEDEECVV
jgi:hypothetical protein